jgi:hypothetical protein
MLKYRHKIYPLTLEKPPKIRHNIQNRNPGFGGLFKM